MWTDGTLEDVIGDARVVPDEVLERIIRDDAAVADDALRAIQQHLTTTTVDLPAFTAAAGVLHGDAAELCIAYLGGRDELLAKFAEALRARGALPADDTTRSTAGRLDPEELRRFTGLATAARCWVEVDGRFAGTGCLVGPGLVLTAWHVVHPRGPDHADEPPSRVVVLLSDRTRHDAVMPPLFESPCGDAEWRYQRAPSSDSEVADRHDAALLALQTPAARHLGHIELPDTPPDIASHSLVFLFDLPGGRDGKLAHGATWRVRNLTARLYHDIPTEGGSSGGACFDGDFRLLGLHQGAIAAAERRALTQGRLVPLARFRDGIAERIARDIAPVDLWHLDAEPDEFIIGRDTFLTAIAAAGTEHTLVRGVHVKRVKLAEGVDRGLGYSHRILEDLLLRRGGAHTIVTVPLDASTGDLVSDIGHRVEAAGFTLPATATAAPSDASPATMESGSNNRARLLAQAIDLAAEAAGRTVWFFVDNPAVPLAEVDRLQLEAFVAACLVLPRIRLVIAGLETVRFAGQEFSSAAAAKAGVEPGLVVEYLGGVKRDDVRNFLSLVHRDLTGKQDPGLVEFILGPLLIAFEAEGGVYADADLPGILKQLHYYVADLRERAPRRAERAATPPAPPSTAPPPAAAHGERAVEPPRAVVDTGIVRAFEHAALSGPFDPVEALQTIDPAGRASEAVVVEVAAALSRDCDKIPTEAAVTWLLRNVPRRRTLDELHRSGRLLDAIARRRGTSVDDATRDLLDAITGSGIFTEDAVDAAVRDADRGTLERLALGIGRADGHAARHADLVRIKAALTRLQLHRPARAARRGPEPGHRKELDRILHWLDTEVAGEGPMTLYIEGLRGVGKSTLVEDVAARLLGQDDDWVVVRLDFDRSGLDVQDMVGLTIELTRQAAAQLPGHAAALDRARKDAAGTERGAAPLKGDTPERVPLELGRALARALADSGRRILMVLDDLELLRRRGETHPARLYDWLDQLAALTKTPIAVIGAGRGDALHGVHARVGQRIVLPGLDDVGADAALERLHVDPVDRPAVRAIARGDPLTLRLAARVATEHGPDALLRAGGRGDSTAAYLCRFLLSKVQDPVVRKIANPAVVARRIDADVIRDVVGPFAGLRDLAPERAEELHAALARLDWLFEPDPLAPGLIRPVADLRRYLLSRMHDSAPTKTARIDRAAARAFGGRSEPWAPTEAAYHRLQLMRRNPEPPKLPRDVLARLDADSIAELPPTAQDLVRRSRGGRAGRAPSEPATRGVALRNGEAQELRALNGRSDWIEADQLYERVFRGAALDPESPEAEVVLTFLWRSGRWSEVRRLMVRQGGWQRPGTSLAGQLANARLETICRLEMGAEFEFGSLVDALADEVVRSRVGRIASEATLTSLLGAGLRFALHRAGERIARPGVDPVAEAAGLWDPVKPASEPLQAGPVADPVDVATARLAMARAAAALTPFASLVETMSRLPAHLHLAEYAAAVQRGLEPLDGLAAGRPEASSQRSANPALALDAFIQRGLLAELIGAAAYLQRDPDLRLVAAAAERWRRTVGGTWSYATAAPSPGWKRALDVTQTDRLMSLVATPDPAAAAAADLEAWAPEHPSGAEVLALLRERSPRYLADAARTAAIRGTAQAASVLLRRGVPSAFVPGAAILLTPPDRLPTPERPNP